MKNFEKKREKIEKAATGKSEGRVILNNDEVLN